MKSSHTARAVIGVVALLLTFAVAGCDENDPSSSPPPSSTPSSPDSSSPTEATSTGSSGAAERLTPVETVRAWVAAHNTALGSGDTEEVVALTGPACSTCDELRKSVAAVHRAGGYFHGGRWKVDAAEVTHRSSDSVTVTAGVTVNAGTTKSNRHADPEAYPEEKFVLKFEVGPAGGRDVVTRIVFLS